MSYKTELHCHSNPVSSCAHLSPEQLAEHYMEQGYTTVVLTNHFHKSAFSPKHYAGEQDWNSKIRYFLHDYNAMRKAAGDRLHVLLGAEFRIDAYRLTDYLVYGVCEELLYELEGVLDLSAKEFSQRIRGAGCMLYQAHPFRNGMTVTDPALLDGVEVYNATPRDSKRNPFSELWADAFGLKKIAGTDFHARSNAEFPNGEHAQSGILTKAPITSNEELLAVLQSENYTLLRGDE